MIQVDTRGIQGADLPFIPDAAAASVWRLLYRYAEVTVVSVTFLIWTRSVKLVQLFPLFQRIIGPDPSRLADHTTRR